jgi:hypothetical protein
MHTHKSHTHTYIHTYIHTGNLLIGLMTTAPNVLPKGEGLAVIRGDAECTNPTENPTTPTSTVGSGWMDAFNTDGSVAGSNGLEGLYAGFWQLCWRGASGSNLSPSMQAGYLANGGYLPGGDNGGFIATGISLFLQDYILGVWVTTPYVTDGLHAAWTRGMTSVTSPTSQVLSLYGPTGRMLAPGAPFTSSPPNGSLLVRDATKRCDDFSNLDDASGLMPIAADGTVTYTTLSAATANLPSDRTYMYQVCINATGANAVTPTYIATGLSIEMASQSSDDVGTFYVNDVQYWRAMYLPWGVAGTKVSYRMRADKTFSAGHAFRLVPEAESCINAAGPIPFPINRYTDVRVYTDGRGNWNQTDIQRLFGAQGILNTASAQKLCFCANCLSSGAKYDQPYVDTPVRVYRQDAAAALSVNNREVNSGLRISLPKIAGSVFRYRTVDLLRRAQAGDRLALVSPQGNCSSPYDNPQTVTGSASGHLTAQNSDGVIFIDASATILAPFFYQVCMSVAGSSVWIPTGLRIEVLARSILQTVVQGTLSPARESGLLPPISVSLVTETLLESVNYFFGTSVRADLYRCASACGTLVPGMATCTSPCTQWSNVSGLLRGDSAELTEGLALFTALSVQGSAGRFYLTLRWSKDDLSAITLPEFIVYPSALRIDGGIAGQALLVGKIPDIHEPWCATLVYPRNDVRCYGYAVVPSINVTLTGTTNFGAQLFGVGPRDEFRIRAYLVQGRDGVRDESYTQVP